MNHTFIINTKNTFSYCRKTGLINLGRFNTTSMPSTFKTVEIPVDPTLTLNKMFFEDKDPNKISLGVGAYRDEDGKPWILPSVRMAKQYMYENQDKFNHEYPPQAGFADFLRVTQNLLLGKEHNALKEQRVASC